VGINATLIGQMIAFTVFVLFCTKFVWPPLTKALEERRRKIADGLAAAENSSKELEKAQAEATEVLKAARVQATQILDAAHQRANVIEDEAKASGVAERDRQIASAKAEIDTEANRAREQLRTQVAALAVAGAEKLIKREIDPNVHKALLDELIAEI
jgi:F-type H+-transporting ATPase subunit b